eukprot:TRINITY_DN25450_c0_g2_i2.p1 TRINITY_DN25450_c0_g2~~TRINITY_DN25450_c0_g2_i2.p1  ORF type:complete len:257 (+),score=62.54 TRINITY_DN25450_c0_g2_i2:33-803(+)
MAKDDQTTKSVTFQGTDEKHAFKKLITNVKQIEIVTEETDVDPMLQKKIEASAEQAMKSVRADWGPVFVYGSFLCSEAWGQLIGRVPEMQTAMLKGYARRSIKCSGVAALLEWEGERVIGQVAYGLMPWERRLLDAVIEDTFYMTTTTVNLFCEEPPEDLEVVTYFWRDEFMDALTEHDWDIEHYQEEWLPQFGEFCKDMQEQHRTDKMGDDELKELSLARRRRQGGDDDDEAEDEEQDWDQSAAGSSRRPSKEPS